MDGLRLEMNEFSSRIELVENDLKEAKKSLVNLHIANADNLTRVDKLDGEFTAMSATMLKTSETVEEIKNTLFKESVERKSWGDQISEISKNDRADRKNTDVKIARLHQAVNATNQSVSENKLINTEISTRLKTANRIWWGIISMIGASAALLGVLEIL